MCFVRWRFLSVWPTKVLRDEDRRKAWMTYAGGQMIEKKIMKLVQDSWNVGSNRKRNPQKFNYCFLKTRKRYTAQQLATTTTTMQIVFFTVKLITVMGKRFLKILNMWSSKSWWPGHCLKGKFVSSLMNGRSRIEEVLLDLVHIKEEWPPIQPSIGGHPNRYYIWMHFTIDGIIKRVDQTRNRGGTWQKHTRTVRTVNEKEWEEASRSTEQNRDEERLVL